MGAGRHPHPREADYFCRLVPALGMKNKPECFLKHPGFMLSYGIVFNLYYERHERRFRQGDRPNYPQ